MHQLLLLLLIDEEEIRTGLQCGMQRTGCLQSGPRVRPRGARHGTKINCSQHACCKALASDCPVVRAPAGGSSVHARPDASARSLPCWPLMNLTGPIEWANCGSINNNGAALAVNSVELQGVVQWARTRERTNCSRLCHDTQLEIVSWSGAIAVAHLVDLAS